MSSDTSHYFLPGHLMELLMLMRKHPDYTRRYFPELTLGERLKLGDSLVRLQGELMQCRRRTPGAAADAVGEMFAQLYDDFAKFFLPKFNEPWDFRQFLFLLPAQLIFETARGLDSDNSEQIFYW